VAGIHSVVNLLDWEDTLSPYYIKDHNLNLEVILLLSNLAACSVVLRDSILETDILSKIKQHIFQGDYSKVSLADSINYWANQLLHSQHLIYMAQRHCRMIYLFYSFFFLV
jgi:hypothetical protein